MGYDNVAGHVKSAAARFAIPKRRNEPGALEGLEFNRSEVVTTRIFRQDLAGKQCTGLAHLQFKGDGTVFIAPSSCLNAWIF